MCIEITSKKGRSNISKVNTGVLPDVPTTGSDTFHTQGRRQNSLPLTTNFSQKVKNHLKESVTQLVTFADISQS